LIKTFDLKISEYKEFSYAIKAPGSKHLLTRHSPFSRVDLIKSSFFRYAPGLSPAYPKELPPQIGITVDASGIDAVTNFDNIEFINQTPLSISYAISNGEDVLVINSGGGIDVAAALKNGKKVTAVESSRPIIDLVKNTLGSFSGEIYKKADVFWDNGRTFIKRSNKKFDIIIISIAGSNLGGVSGLKENYLLTKQALEKYYSKLKKGGFIVITRWLSFPPKESLKLVSLALSANVNSENMALFRSFNTITLIIGKESISQVVAQKIKKFTEKNSFDIIHIPKIEFTPNKHLTFKEPFFHTMVKELLKNREVFESEYIFNIQSSTDDKPFYFNFFKLSKVEELSKMLGKSWNPFFDSGFILLFIIIQAFILSVLFILLPALIKIKKSTIPIRSSKYLFYFFLVGLSYMMTEIVFIQKFVLLLGHIVISSTVIIASMLISSAVGALYSQKKDTVFLKIVIPLISLLIIIITLISPIIGDVFIGTSMIVRVFLAIIISSSVGFFMGFPMAIVIRTLDKKLIPIAWAVNGCASVLGSLTAILLAIFIGYSAVLYITAFIYFAALMILPKHFSE